VKLYLYCIGTLCKIGGFQHEFAIYILRAYVESYEDWFYLNKKCTCCGEVKLANEHHFGWDKTNNRFKSQCLDCIAEAQKERREKKATKGRF
jgi:hypothetical protein